MGRPRKRVVEDSDEECRAATGPGLAASSSLTEPRPESATEGLPGKRRRLVLRGATRLSSGGDAFGSNQLMKTVSEQASPLMTRTKVGRKKKRQVSSSCSEPEAPQVVHVTPVLPVAAMDSKADQKIPPAPADFAFAGSDCESDGVAPTVKRAMATKAEQFCNMGGSDAESSSGGRMRDPVTRRPPPKPQSTRAEKQRRFWGFSDAESSAGEHRRRPERACAQRTRAHVQDFIDGLADSGAESSGSSASSDRIATRMAPRPTADVTSAKQRRPKFELPNVDADPEVEVWQADLNSRCAKVSDLSSAFSRSPCGPTEIRHLSPRHFIASQPIFEKEGRVNLHLLLGAFRMLTSSPEACTSVDARHVLWLAARARGLGLVLERELEKGRLSRRVGQAGQNRGSRRQRNGRRHRVAAFGGDSPERDQLLMGGDLRFPVQPPAHKRRAVDGDAASRSRTTNCSGKGSCSKAADHVDDELFSDVEEDAVQQFVRRKRAVMDLRTRHHHQSVHIKSLSSHAVNLEEVTSALMAPKLSFDWDELAKDTAQEDESDDGGGVLEVTVPQNDPRRDFKRSLLRDHIHQNLSVLQARKLSHEVSNTTGNNAALPGLMRSAAIPPASTSTPAAAESTAGAAAAAAAAAEARTSAVLKEPAADKKEFTAHSKESADPPPSLLDNKESELRPEQLEAQRREPERENEKEEEEDRMVFCKPRRRRVLDEESDNESCTRALREASADTLPDSSGMPSEPAVDTAERTAVGSVVEPIRSHAKATPKPGSVLSLLVAPMLQVPMPALEAEAETGGAVVAAVSRTEARGVLAKLLAPAASAVPTPARCHNSPTTDVPGGAAPPSATIEPSKVLLRPATRRVADRKRTQDCKQNVWKKQALLLDIFKRSTVSAKGSMCKGLSRLRRARMCPETFAERSAEKCGDDGSAAERVLQESSCGMGDALEPEVLAVDASSGRLAEDPSNSKSADEAESADFEEESGEESLVHESEEEEMQDASGEECSENDLEVEATEAAVDHRRRREALREKRRQARVHERRLRWELEDMSEIGDEVERIVHFGTTTMSEEDRRRWRKVIGTRSTPGRLATGGPGVAEGAATTWTVATTSASSRVQGSTTIAHRGGGRRLHGGRGEDDGGHLYTLAGTKTPRAKFLGTRPTQQH